ncbi:unnamed protein product [Symbiodinium sp. CCMP2592]|nr:unnamed protein product [Symbiodinium sp. CCMP2592]
MEGQGQPTLPVKQETEEEDFSPRTLAMIASLDDSVESQALVAQLKEAAPTSEHVKKEATTPEERAPFPPEPPMPPMPKEPALVPKEPSYPPPGWGPKEPACPPPGWVPQEPKMSGPPAEDLLRQQKLLAEQMYEAARQEAPVPGGPSSTEMQQAWLQQQHDVMKQQQTQFLIKQEQARMDFLNEQQKQFEMQHQAVLVQMQQQGCTGQAAVPSFGSVGGPMLEAMSIQEDRRRQFMVEQERLLQQQQREEMMEKQRMEQQLQQQRQMEEQRMEQERLQREQDEAARAAEEERLLLEEEEVRRAAQESQRMAKELYELEARAERLRNHMIAQSSQSKAPGVPRYSAPDSRRSAQNSPGSRATDSVYSPADDRSINKGRLEALIRLRQSTKEWKKNTQGFEWCTIADMEAKGAKKYCSAKRLFKTCPYTGEYKFLVLVSDTVQQGQEKLRELEELMEEAGFFNDQFQLGCGDSFEISDDESVPDSKAAEGKNGRKGGGRGGVKTGLPLIVEGDKDLTANLGKYKKALLNKRTVLKEVKDRLVDEKCSTHQSLVTQHMNIVLLMVMNLLIGELNVFYKAICDMELVEK